MRMRLALKKPEDTRYIKYYIKILLKYHIEIIRPKAPGVRVKNLIPNLPLLGTAD